MEYESIRELDETKVNVVGKKLEDHDDVRLLWAKNMQIWRDQRAYWRFFLERGKTCYDFQKGKIFDDATRAEYEDVLDKYCVEPRKMKPAIMTLVGEMIKSKRSGRVTSEGANLDQEASAEELQIINFVLKHAEQAWKEQPLMRDCLHDALITCYPVWLWFIRTSISDSNELGAVHPVMLPWDSCVCGPFNFRRVDGSDVTSLSRLEIMSDEELVDYWPDQADVVREHSHTLRDQAKGRPTIFDDLKHWDITSSSEQKDMLLFDVMTGIASATGPSAAHRVVDRTYQIITKHTVAVDVFNPQQYEIRPGTWDEERWHTWLEGKAQQEHTQYVEVERPVKLLWQTVFTDTGLVLDNDLHFFQENGKMPGICCLPSIEDKMPSGPGVDMLDDLLAMAVAETEYLDDLRKGTGTTLVTRDGTISNIEALPTEISKAMGVITLRAEAPPINNCIYEMKRTANEGYREYGEKKELDLENTTMITRSLQGAVVPQQAGVAKSLEIAQGLMTQSLYVDNYNLFWSGYQNLKLVMLPYSYNRHQVLQIIDEETDQMAQVEVNRPEYDQAGDVTEVINDLTSHLYKWKMTPVDDSPTAKDFEQKQALIFVNAAAGPLMQADPSGLLLARYMNSARNRMLKDMGKMMLQDVQRRAEQQGKQAQMMSTFDLQERMAKLRIEAERAKNQGKSLSVTGDQLAEFPQLAELLEQIGFFGSQPQPQQAPAREAVPA